MAKSILAKTDKSTVKKLTTNVVELNNTLNINIRGGRVIDLNSLYHYKCDLSEKRLPDRKNHTSKLINGLKEWCETGNNHAVIYGLFFHFKRYCTFCDLKGVSPFSKKGFTLFLGNDGEIWRLVKKAREPKEFIFLYDDNEEIGLKESTAVRIRSNISRGLELAEVDSFTLKYSFHSFKAESSVSVTKPYRDNEMELILRRVQFYFFSLATQLTEYSESNNGEQPFELERVKVDYINNKDIYIPVKASKNSSGRKGGGKISSNSPFNQCMAAGYCLFSYYTSFNDSSILDVRHPLEFVTSKKDGRTIKHVTVRGWKGRSSKEVQALFSDLDNSEELDVKSIGDDAGAIFADVSKTDGQAFIKALSQVSRLYSKRKHSKLIHYLNENSEECRFTQDSISLMAVNLNLLSNDRLYLIDYLCDIFNKILRDNSFTTIKVSTSDIGSQFVSKKVHQTDSRTAKRLAIQYAFAALSCLGDIELKNILLPLKFSEIDSDGNILVHIKYLDNSEVKLPIPAKYKKFIESVQEYAARYNPYENKRIKKPAYLLPLGTRSMTKQWLGLSPLSISTLSNIGIYSGDFFIDLNSGRFRVSTSDKEYKSEDGGYTARVLLQHGKAVSEKRYVNGHPIENTIITNQSMQVFEEIVTGKTSTEAKKSIREKLGITVLAYDDYKNKRLPPTNLNGTVCDGKPELIEGKDEHKAAMRHIDKLKLNEGNLDIQCYQYDLCVVCKNAKLVDDVHSIYKLLSFVECLEDAADTFPDTKSEILKKANDFKSLVEDNIPVKTIEQAEERLAEEGRYEMFDDINSVAQYI